MVLSGMSTLNQLKENVATFGEDKTIKPHRNGHPVGHGQGDGAENCPTLHCVPLLRQPLSPKDWTSPACWPCTTNTVSQMEDLSLPWR